MEAEDSETRLRAVVDRAGRVRAALTELRVSGRCCSPCRVHPAALQTTTPSLSLSTHTQQAFCIQTACV